MKKSLLLSFCSLCALTVALDGTAQAQTIDYGSLESLMGQSVTTNASGTPQTAGDVATNMTIITADEIRQSGSRSIPQILKRVPGLDIMQASSTGFDVGVRGYQQSMQPSLLVLIDGRQVFTDDYSRMIWSSLPVNIDDVRQIEVVLGPASALFGSNAAHGVVNIITYNPLYDSNGSAAVSTGTQNTLTGDATVNHKFDNGIGMKLSAGGMENNEFNTPRLAATANAKSEQTVTVNPEHRYLVANGTYQIGPKLLAFSEATFSSTLTTLGFYNGQLAAVKDEVYSARAGFSWESPIGTIKNNNYFTHTAIDNTETTSAFPYYRDTEGSYTSQWEDQFKVGADHTARLSIEYNHKDFNIADVNQIAATPTAPAANSTIHEDNAAIGGMWLWQISDPLSWTNAVRFDRLQLSETGPLVFGQASAPFNHVLDEVSANSGLVYKATPLDVLHLTFGRGIQMPSLLDYGENFLTKSPAGQVVERLGNPNLDAAIVTNYEVGYDRMLPEIMSKAKLSVYYQQNDDVLTPFETVNNGPLTIGTLKSAKLREATNSGSSHGFGGEFQLSGQAPSGIRWDASYSYALVNDSASVLHPVAIGTGVTPTTNSFGYQDSTPVSHVRFLLGYTTGPWEFDTFSEYQTGRIILRNLTRTGSDGYFAMNARVGYQVAEKTTVALSAQNLNQSQTVESPYPAIQRQVILSLTQKF